MNPKQMRKIRYKAKRILLEWVKHLVKKENQHNITSEKFKILLDTISYKWNGTTKVLQPMSYRWLVQTLKKNPEATLEDIEKILKDQYKSTDVNDLESYTKYLKSIEPPKGEEIGPEQLIKMKLPKKLQKESYKPIKLSKAKQQTDRLFA